PRKIAPRSLWVTSAGTKVAFPSARSGGRRATATTSSTRDSDASAPSRLVPTFPVAPTITTRMNLRYPGSERTKPTARKEPGDGYHGRDRPDHRYQGQELQPDLVHRAVPQQRAPAGDLRQGCRARWRLGARGFLP